MPSNIDNDIISYMVYSGVIQLEEKILSLSKINNRLLCAKYFENFLPNVIQNQSTIQSIPTYGCLESSWYQAPCGLLGAGQQGEEGEQEPQHRVAGHDDRVRGHAPGPRVPATGHSDEGGVSQG